MITLGIREQREAGCQIWLRYPTLLWELPSEGKLPRAYQSPTRPAAQMPWLDFVPTLNPSTLNFKASEFNHLHGFGEPSSAQPTADPVVLEVLLKPAALGKGMPE